MLKFNVLRSVSSTTAVFILVASFPAACRPAADTAPVPVQPTPSSAGGTGRAIRRDIPLSAGIRRALAAGTRDSTGRPGRRYWQLWTDYTIHARLDPATATVTGRETIVIHNTSDSALWHIMLRLDQNVFRPGAMSQVARFMLAKIDDTEGMVVTKLSVDGRAVELTTVSGLTTTVATVPLPTAVPANTSVSLAVEWHFRVSATNLRMGRWGDSLYQIGQWYPRVMAYDDLNGWDTEPYLGLAEFYNNYGRFDVTLDVPAGWLVGATGVLQNTAEVLSPTARARLAQVLTSDSVHSIVSASERGIGRATAIGERRRWRFVADTASDFAWATSARYVWSATRAVIPGRRPIPVHIFYLPDDAATAREYHAAIPKSVRHALEFYSKLVMPYAFSQCTIVQGPGGGMEYPMYAVSGLSVVDHEVGHQWFPNRDPADNAWTRTR